MNQPDPELVKIFSELVGRFCQSSPPFKVKVSFYPYTGLNNTIRLRNQQIIVRLSDILANAPLTILHALASILVAKLFRKRVSKEAERTFRDYTSRPEIINISRDVRQQRGYKQITSAQGRVYNLVEVYQKLNFLYFNNQLPQLILTWSQRRTKRLLGHHDPIHNTIVISKTLDNIKVPRYFIEYILYHEMLHVKHKPRIINSRCYYHTKEFYQDERAFVDYKAAMAWLNDFVASKR